MYCIAYISFHHIPNVRNKTSYEAPSFHMSGKPPYVPYAILTHSHIFRTYHYLL